jgi:hypothetical protein
MIQIRLNLSKFEIIGKWEEVQKAVHDSPKTRPRTQHSGLRPQAALKSFSTALGETSRSRARSCLCCGSGICIVHGIYWEYTLYIVSDSKSCLLSAIE